MKRYIVGLAILILSGCFMFFVSLNSPTGYSVRDNDLRVISVEDWVDGSSSEGVILDIRTKEEFEEYHIPGAINVDFYSESFLDELGELDRSKIYFTYCRTGRRSGIALDSFRQLGFKSVYDLKAGVVNYKNYVFKK